MRIVYAGTPEFAVPALKALVNAGHEVVAVYTQPDRPAGRGRTLTASPVKQCAQALGMPVQQPVNFRDNVRDRDAVEILKQYAPEVMVVAAYGLILPQAVLDIPAQGCLNIHASLLPRWRGAAPIHRAILAGDTHTGITIMCMEAGLDTGPMLRKQSVVIGSTDTTAVLHDRLAVLGAELIVDVLADLPRHLLSQHPQPEAGVTYAAKLRKEEARIDWTLAARDIDRQVRAFNPWPVAETTFQHQQLRIWMAHATAEASAATPGQVVRSDAMGIHVATGQGVLCITQLQQAGRKQISATEFAKAHDLAGMVLGDRL